MIFMICADVFVKIRVSRATEFMKGFSFEKVLLFEHEDDFEIFEFAI